jgi:hypothetical protein
VLTLAHRGSINADRATLSTETSQRCDDYELLALVDALRGPTDARTLRLARELLTERLRDSLPA